MATRKEGGGGSDCFLADSLGVNLRHGLVDLLISTATNAGPAKKLSERPWALEDAVTLSAVGHTSWVV